MRTLESVLCGGVGMMRRVGLDLVPGVGGEDVLVGREVAGAEDAWVAPLFGIEGGS